jgi:hypothetical protein
MTNCYQHDSISADVICSGAAFVPVFEPISNFQRLRRLESMAVPYGVKLLQLARRAAIGAEAVVRSFFS